MNSIKHLLLFVVASIVAQSGFAQTIDADEFFANGEASAATACQVLDSKLMLINNLGEVIYSDEISPEPENKLSVTSVYKGQGGMGVIVSQDGELLGYKMERYDIGWLSSELVYEFLCVFNGYPMEELKELYPAR